MKALVVEGSTSELPTPSVTYPGLYLHHLIVPDLGVVITPYMGEFYVSLKVQDLMDAIERSPNLHEYVEVNIDADLVTAIETFIDGHRLLQLNLAEDGHPMADAFSRFFWHSLERPAAQSA